ncbi:polysaccharide pyruvyl transferase family protein [Pseudovibrio exalbescens]|nr:polysaccharide pyruvyl transferase family protein [Pseudovibrio exalbescens]MDD7910890.1 polysaccharide pyruvyl transferase family protein [Pseudovibrio exalbescens]
MTNLTNLLAKHASEPCLFWPVASDWSPFEARLRSMSLDAIVVNGEGSIHTVDSRPRARQLLGLSRFAKELGVPSFLVNSSLFNLDDQAFEALNSFSKILVRESRSKEYLEKNGINCEIAPDLSMVDLSFRPEACGERTTKLATDSVFPSYSREIKAFADKHSFVFESMQRKPTWLEKRRKKIKKSLGVFPATRLYKPTSDFHSFLKRIGEAQLVVTGRFHTVTLCLLTSTPFIAVESNTPKISALVGDCLGDDERVVSLERLKNLSAGDLERLSRFSEAEHASINEFLYAGTNSANSFFSRMFGF